MTGPSLAGLWHRKAGSLASFTRYSPALKASGISWDDATLDAWLADPQRLVPGNTMPFAGIEDAGQRHDLIAFLKDVTQPGHAVSAQGGRTGGMMGMMGSGSPNLRNLEAAMRITKITHCRDSYRVTTADGKVRDFWERNLRFKTDTSEEGPEKGTPALVPAGILGDRADVIFADPHEISAAIVPQC
jgi:cytochrome c